MTKQDKILIIILVIIALASFAGHRLWSKGQQVTTAEISADGKIVERIDLQGLTQQKEFSVQGPLGSTVVQVRDGEARIVSSPCPDKICIRMGWLKSSGQSAVCVPNHILLHIVSEENNQIDSISR